MQNDMTIDGYDISTWFADGIEPYPYQAVNMSVAREILKGYDLATEEQLEVPALMVGYCRLVEEAGLIGF